MRHADLGSTADAASALPRLQQFVTLKETDGFTRGVTRRRDAEGIQMPALDAVPDAGEINGALKQLTERRAVEQRSSS